MMTQEQLRRECVEAFKKGYGKEDAERLLPQIEQPADLRTITSKCTGPKGNTSLVSLLHLAAVHGWMDIIIVLITKCKCDTNCKDSDGCTPLHYAVNNNCLEVVKYLINEQHCDPMTRDNFGNTPLHYVCRYAYLNAYLTFMSKIPSIKNDIPLPFALQLNLAKYLIYETHSNPSCENNNGTLPEIKDITRNYVYAQNTIYL